MKMEIATIIGLVGQVAQMVEGGKRTITAIRAIIERDHPGDLDAFDAAVAKARAPWQQAADAAQADEGGAQ